MLSAVSTRKPTFTRSKSTVSGKISSVFPETSGSLQRKIISVSAKENSTYCCRASLLHSPEPGLVLLKNLGNYFILIPFARRDVLCSVHSKDLSSTICSLVDSICFLLRGNSIQACGQNQALLIWR